MMTSKTELENDLLYLEAIATHIKGDDNLGWRTIVNIRLDSLQVRVNALREFGNKKPAGRVHDKVMEQVNGYQARIDKVMGL